MAIDTWTVAVDLPLAGAGTAYVKVPAAAYGGGATVTAVEAFNGAATGSGTGVSIDVLKLSSAGTPAVNGTVVLGLGGTADPFAAGVPKRASLTASSCKISAGEYLGIKVNAITSGTITVPAQCLITFVQGVTGA